MDTKIVESSYPLSPMQHGMLFHSLSTEGDGVYIQQMVCDLHEDLNVPAFARSWQRVVERHPILRTSFSWDGLAEPVQDVYRRVELPLEQRDWRGLSASQREKQWEVHLREDQRRGFKLTSAPLMRLTLFRLAQTDYRLLWSSHHALFDGRSRLQIFKEIFSLYEAYCRDQDLVMEQPAPYRKYIEWLQRQDWSDSEKFWTAELRGFSAPTPLVSERTLGHTLGFESDEQRLRLSAAATSALESLVKRDGLTLNAVVQGAWALLLSRYCGEEEVVFGVTRACRTPLAVSGPMIGLFINTLPLRIRVSPEKPVSVWLQELRARNLAIRDYEHTPLLKIKGWSDLPMATQLFESLVVFEVHELNAALRAQGAEWQAREFKLLERTNYPLTLSAYAGPELLLRIVYSRQRFDDDSIRRMLGHLQTLLEAFVDDPQKRISELPLLTQSELEQIQQWSKTARACPASESLHAKFEAQVECTPEGVAVAADGEELSYWELNRRANQLAHHLRAMAVGREQLVAILQERSVEMVVSVLAVLKAGGAYVPLDAKLPLERLQYMLDEGRISCLLTQTRVIEQRPVQATQVVCVDRDRSIIEQQSEANPVVTIAPANLAYVMFTSGSSGKPKAVACSHAGVTNLLADFQLRNQLAVGDRCSMWTSLSFDVSVYETFSALSVGATLLLQPEDVRYSEQACIRWLSSQAITSAYLPPFMLRGFGDWLGNGGTCSLRRLLVGVEPIPAALLEQIGKHLPALKIINGYGPTEASICATAFEVERNNVKDDEAHVVPIGRPVQDSSVYLLDSYLRFVPMGVPGEIYIGGAGLARGYLGRAELTGERFIPDPYSERAGARMYLSGDRGRYLGDGNIEFLGRVDQQVKVRGIRIEPGEVEAALRQHEGVGEAVVLVREDGGEKRLVAYLRGPGGEGTGSGELRQHLRQQLPEYMVPSGFVWLSEWPLTASGKLDRGALPAPELGRRQYVAPRTAAEEVLAKIWATLLGVERVGVEENFFDLGGHSLLATQLLSRVRESLRVELPLAVLFEAPTVAEFAKAVVAQETRAGLVEKTARIWQKIQGIADGPN
jgi:amino acid adenylation domain-containing protein